MKQSQVNKIGQALIASAVEDWNKLREAGVQVAGDGIAWPEGKRQVAGMSRLDGESAISLIRRKLAAWCDADGIDPYAAFSRLGLPEKWVDSPPEDQSGVTPFVGPSVPAFFLDLASGAGLKILAYLYLQTQKSGDPTVICTRVKLAEILGAPYQTITFHVSRLKKAGIIEADEDSFTLCYPILHKYA